MTNLINPAQTTLDVLTAIYEGLANGPYGLTLINQRSHAVQSAHLARTRKLSSSLVVAALLHDIGHMVHKLGEHPAARGVDDRHEALGADWLSQYFNATVTGPVRLHVDAKRYLCKVEPDYFSRLSKDSVESLALQGGPMSDDEVTAFRQKAFWVESVALRRIDDLAKDPDGPMPVFSTFSVEILEQAEHCRSATGLAV